VVNALFIVIIIALVIAVRAEHRKVKALRRAIKKQSRRFLS
jgi:hypothetical protein